MGLRPAQCNVGGNPTCEFGDGFRKGGLDPRLRSHVRERAMRAGGGGGGDVRATAMAMARMTTGTDGGEDERWQGAKLS